MSTITSRRKTSLENSQNKPFLRKMLKQHPKIGPKPDFAQYSEFDIFRTMRDTIQRFGEGRTHTLKSLWTKYQVLTPQNDKTPRQFSDLMISADFSAIFKDKWSFRQHRGQQMLTKTFSSKQAHQTEQKTLL